MWLEGEMLIINETVCKADGGDVWNVGGSQGGVRRGI